MPRQRKHPRVFIALSPSACADACQISYPTILSAISAGELPVRTYTQGNARRILVSDLEAWLRTYWTSGGAKPKRKSPNGS